MAAGTPEGSEATGPAASSSTSGSTGASSKGRRAGSSAGAGTGSGTGVAPADASAADAKALRRLGATMESRLRALAEQEAAVKRAQVGAAVPYRFWQLPLLYVSSHLLTYALQIRWGLLCRTDTGGPDPHKRR